MITTSVCVLASTSSGNATLLFNPTDAILIDCGISKRYLTNCLSEHSLSVGGVSAILITHLHTDHVNEVTLQIASSNGIPLFCETRVAKAIERRFSELLTTISVTIIPFDVGEVLTHNSFQFQAFSVPHDSDGGCFGFRILSNQKHTISISTDMGYTSDEIIPYFLESDIIVLESNHDELLLKESGRPPHLIERILKTGHLSNLQCSELLTKILKRTKKEHTHIFLAHISQECNRIQLALETTENALVSNHIHGFTLYKTFKNTPSELLSLP